MMKNNLVFAAILFNLLTSCSKHEADRTPAPTTPEESSECLTSSSYSSSAYLTGTATFSKRTLNVSHSAGTVTRLILSQNATSTNLPIRYAEVQVTDSGGSTVQCGRTNASGAIKALDGVSDLVIPSSAGNYTVYIYARSNTSIPVAGGKPSFTFRTSIKNDLSNNSVYAISATVSSAGTGATNVNVNATHSENSDSTIPGGAFNIYNDILTAYDYLAFNTGTIDISCLNPKLDVYWKAGFNPAQYIYPSADPGSLGTVSYYIKGQNQMFINGGRLGSVSSEDTDHFDDAVIIHELGHHVEAVCGTMDSPGGTHNGQFRIDPRLAWSEGWGNFFGAHIIRNKLSDINPDLSTALPASGWLFYFDSEGYGTSTGFEYIRINLARLGNNTSETLYTSSGTGSVTYDQVSPTSFPGEGHFREVSVARGLFKGTNTCTNCLGSSYFTNYWQALENRAAGIGMGKSSYPFRSSIKFIDRIKAAQGGTLAGNLTTLFTTDEALQPLGSADYVVGGNTIWVPYAAKLAPGTCNLRIQPRRNNLAANTDSDQRYSNHFFLIDKNSLAGVTSINISSADVVWQSTGTNGVDFDLILFPANYKFNQDYQEDSNGSIVSYNKTNPSDAVGSSRNSGNTESINISGLSAGSFYLLNLRAYSSTPMTTPLATTEYSYIIKDQSGGVLCPTNSF